jgi:hypothetical protein
MALGTPVAAAAAYSALNGTTVTPAYPAGILATDVVLLFVGQKPGSANSGTNPAPSGWTLREELTGAGGYGATLGADTGNTNLRVFSWNTPIAGQTGNLNVSLGNSNVAWAFIVRIPTGGGAISYGSADGQQTATPTSPMTNALTNGATATNFESGDLAIWAMCIPTDVQTPAQFSNHLATATGATFAAGVEINEPDSTTGNDIGGFSAYASVTSGSSTAAPSITVTLAGTLTNVRGPVVMLRVREAPVAQTLTPDLYTNTQTFHNPTVVQEQFLTPALYTNDQTFYAADVTQAGGAQNLDPALYTNTQTFYAATVAASNTLTPALYTNNQTFYSATVAASNTLLPDLYTNAQTFFAPTVTATYALTPARYDNSQTFFAATVTRGAVTLTPGLYTNGQTFYAATVTPGGVTLTASPVENTSVFYSPTVSQGGVVLQPALYTNDQTFYAATVTAGAVTLTPARYDNGNTFFAAALAASYALTPARYDNSNTFFAATLASTYALAPARYDNTNTFYAATVSSDAAITPARYDNSQTFFAATVSATYELTPARYDNGNTFYAATVAQVSGLTPARYDNANTFYAATVSATYNLTPGLYSNTSQFFSATVTANAVTLAPALYTNSNQFFSAAATSNYNISFGDYVDPGYVDPGYVSPAAFNTNTFFSASLSLSAAPLFPGLVTNTSTFYAPRVAPDRYIITADQARQLFEIYLLHGLGAPALVVGENARSAGAVQQSVAQSGETVSISTTAHAAYTDVDPGAMIEELAALHGLTATLSVTPTTRTAGGIVQSMAVVGSTTTVTRQ